MINVEIDVLTIFPEMVNLPLSMSIIGKARENGILKLNVHNLREYSGNKHYAVDDTPYGGGPGMVMKVEPFYNAIKELKLDKKDAHIIMMSPKGAVLKQTKVEKLSKMKQLVILCGHYEGVDERVHQLFVDEEISIGDYVLTGGEIPAIVLIDGIARLLPGVLGHEDSAKEESFAKGLLEYPHYTKPREFLGITVPDVLLSGNHAEIKKWRHRQSINITSERRPDLIDAAGLAKVKKETFN